MVFHATRQLPGLSPFGGQNLWLVVDFFFVLSGFVLAPSYFRLPSRRWRPLCALVVRRWARLWPLAMVTLAGFGFYLSVQAFYERRTGAVGMASALTGETALSELGPHLLLLQAILGVPNSWNGPSWSVSVEFLVNVLLALLFVLLPIRARAMVAVALGVVGVALFFPGDEGAIHGPSALARGWLGISLGLVLRHLHSAVASRWLTRSQDLTSAELLLIGVLLAVFLQPSGMRVSLLAGLAAFMLLVLVFSLEGGGVSRFLARAPFQALGRWSYGIYLWHAAVLASVGGAVEVLGLDSRLGLLLVVAGTLGLAGLTYRLIEIPAVRWSRRGWQGGRAVERHLPAPPRRGASADNLPR